MTAVDEHLTPPEAYQQYFGPAIFEPLADVFVPVAAPRHSERVLDLACGTGIVTRRVAAVVGAGGHVTGVDVNPGMIAAARSQPAPDGAPITWGVGDALALDLPDGAFDLVCCQQGLQFFPDRAAGVREMRRVLAGGGRVAIAVWHGLDEHPLWAALAEAELPHLSALGAAVSWDDLVAPFSLGDAAELRGLLEDAGFRDVTTRSGTVHVRFPDADRFVERMEYAYAAVIPQFAQDRSAFAAYLDRIDRATRAIVARYRDGDWVAVPMHTHLAIAYA